MLKAITRPVSPSIGRCELTHIERQPIDVALAHEQHRRYEAALQALGCHVLALPVEPELPDAVFVEDAALVLDEIAVITRPGAASRRPETHSIAAALKAYRELRTIEPPGTLDGGDILCLGRQIYVGLSSRSSLEAVRQLAEFVKPNGYSVHTVKVTGCLHLKSAVTAAGEQTLLINPDWIDRKIFPGWEIIEVAPEEPNGANVLWVGTGRVYPSQYPYTAQSLEEHGLKVQAVDVSEIIKAEGAVTCCSLIFQ